MQISYPITHPHAITWAGAHATHEAAQTYRDAVEGPSLRPLSAVLFISHTYIAPRSENFPRPPAGVEHNTYIGDTLSLLVPLQRYVIYDLRRVHTSIPERYESSTLSYGTTS